MCPKAWCSHISRRAVSGVSWKNGVFHIRATIFSTRAGGNPLPPLLSSLMRCATGSSQSQKSSSGPLRELIPDRQRADTFAASRKDGIGQGRRDRRQARLACAAKRLVVAGRREEMRANLRRRRVDAGDLVIVEI